MLRRIPLNHLEHFFLWDDHPGYPNTLACRMLCEGRFNRELITRTIELMVARHPLIAGRLEFDSKKRGHWIIGDCQPTIEFQSCDDFSQPPCFSPFDLSKEPGAKLLIREAGNQSELWFLTHHACCDGLGGMQCIGDILVLYDNLSRGRPESKGLRKLDPELLSTRHRFFRSRMDALRHLPFELIGLYGALKFFLYRPLPIAHDAKATDLDKIDAHLPRCLTVGLDASESERLAVSAESRHSTVNGMLTRDLMEALLAWSSELGQPPKSGQPIRLFIPMNVRDFADRRLSAANRVSLVYLDRNAQQISSRPGLLGSINFEMRAIQNWRLGSTFQIFLRLLKPFPNLLRRWLDQPICRATALFTNLGDFYQRLPLDRDESGVRIGDVRIDRLELLAPIRPRTPLAVSAFKFADRQELSFHYDGTTLTEDQIKRLADLTLKSLRRSLEPLATPIESTTSSEEAS